MNLTALNDITPFTVNNSLINETTEIGTNLVSNANVQTQGYFGLGMMIIIFIILLIVLMTEQDVFRFNFLSALTISSGMSLLVGLVLLVSDVSSSFQHVMWFAMIFIIALLSKAYEKR